MTRFAASFLSLFDLITAAQHVLPCGMVKPADA
jgi:hypothetical protein